MFAGALGSQRYNVSIDSSDYDFYVVYQAPTAHVLSLTPPPQITRVRNYYDLLLLLLLLLLLTTNFTRTTQARSRTML